MRPHNLRQAVFLVALFAQGCGFTYEPDPGSMASHGPEAPDNLLDSGFQRVDEGGEPEPNSPGDEDLHVIEPAGQTSRDECDQALDPTANCGDAGVAAQADAGSPVDANDIDGEIERPPGDQGDLCSPTRPCEEGSVCLHDPASFDDDTDTFLPYCTVLCDVDECPQGFHCVDVEPMARICQRNPEE